jgi:hypothetical protein
VLECHAYTIDYLFFHRKSRNNFPNKFVNCVDLTLSLYKFLMLKETICLYRLIQTL